MGSAALATSRVVAAARWVRAAGLLAVLAAMAVGPAEAASKLREYGNESLALMSPPGARPRRSPFAV